MHRRAHSLSTSPLPPETGGGTIVYLEYYSENYTPKK